MTILFFIQDEFAQTTKGEKENYFKWKYRKNRTN